MNIFISGSSISDDFNKTDQSKDLILRIPVFVEIKSLIIQLPVAMSDGLRITKKKVAQYLFI